MEEGIERIEMEFYSNQTACLLFVFISFGFGGQIECTNI
jgi:hypothetical protein